MKRFNMLIGAEILVYVCLAMLLLFGSRYGQNHEDMEYKVEIHDVMRLLEQGVKADGIDLSNYQYVQAIAFLLLLYINFFNKRIYSFAWTMLQEWQDTLFQNMMLFRITMLLIFFIFMMSVLIKIMTGTFRPLSYCYYEE